MRSCLLLALLAVACRSSSTPSTTPSDLTAGAGEPALVRGVFALSGGGDGLMIDDLYIVLDGDGLRAGVRMLQTPQPGAVVEARLCNVHVDTFIRWTKHGFVVPTAIEADGTIGMVTIERATQDFAFDGSKCNVRLDAGEYRVEPRIADDGTPTAILLTSPDGTSQEWTATRLLEIEDYARAAWTAQPH